MRLANFACAEFRIARLIKSMKYWVVRSEIFNTARLMFYTLNPVKKLRKFIHSKPHQAIYAIIIFRDFYKTIISILQIYLNMNYSVEANFSKTCFLSIIKSCPN